MNRERVSQDFELNIASIIDCFTVLIAFMLASTSFLAIGILDAGVAAAGNTATDSTPPPVNVTLQLTGSRDLEVKWSGKETNSVRIPAKSGKADYDAMTSALASVKSRWNGVNAVTLSADNTVEYRDVVQAMDVARKTLPVVLLGGF